MYLSGFQVCLLNRQKKKLMWWLVSKVLPFHLPLVWSVSALTIQLILDMERTPRLQILQLVYHSFNSRKGIIPLYFGDVLVFFLCPIRSSFSLLASGFLWYWLPYYHYLTFSKLETFKHGSLCLKTKQSPAKSSRSKVAWLPGLSTKLVEAKNDITTHFKGPPVPPNFGLKCIGFAYSINLRQVRTSKIAQSSAHLAFP